MIQVAAIIAGHLAQIEFVDDPVISGRRIIC